MTQASITRVQVSISLTPAEHAALSAEASAEGQATTTLAANLFRAGWARYRLLGSLRATLAEGAADAGGRAPDRISRESRAEMLAALEIVIDRAPSTVLAELARVLTQFAGRYGDERAAAPAHQRRKS